MSPQVSAGPRGTWSTSGFVSLVRQRESVGKRFKTAATVIVEVDVGICFFSPTAGKCRETLQDRSNCDCEGQRRDLFL
jgi:hypothetical protein